MNTWTTESAAADVLNLPKGRLAASFGFLVEQSVNPDTVLEAAEYLVAKGFTGALASQAEAIVEAQKLGAFETHAPYQTF